MTKDDSGVAAPDQTVSYSSPAQAKAAEKLRDAQAHTPSTGTRSGGTKYVQGEWNGMPLYRCPLPEDVCQFATIDGDAAVEAHILGAHPNWWMEQAAEGSGG